MTVEYLDSSNLEIDPSHRMWHCYVPGRTVFGNGYTRPLQVVGDKLMFTGIGIFQESISGTYAILSPGGAGVMSGTFRVAEVYYRKLTNERSLAGYYEQAITLSNNKLTIEKVQSCDPLSSELYISHREFYVNCEELGGWYRIGAVEYVPQGPTDSFSFTFNMSTDELMGQRPLEDQLQTSLYPAVSCATYWNGAVYGGGLLGRSFKAGTVITVSKGQRTASISGDKWKQSDILKPVIVNGEPLFFIYRVRSGTIAEIKVPGSTSPGADDWPFDSTSFSEAEAILGGEEQTVYVSPTYVGEAGNGLTRGLVTWNPLNQLRDEYQSSIGSRISAISRQQENLVVFFDRAIVIYQGSPELDVPQPRAVTLTDKIGVLAQHHVWNTRDGAVWWISRERIYTLNGNQVMDVSEAWGNASLLSKMFLNGWSKNYYNWSISYNPTTNQTVIANMTDASVSTGRTLAAGKFALLIDHNRQSFYRLQFPWRVKAVVAVPRSDGLWRWKCLMLNPNPDGSTLLPPYYASLMDDRYEGSADYVEPSDPEGSALPIDALARSGSRYFDGEGIPVAERFLLSGTLGDVPVNITTKVQLNNTNIHSGTFTASFEKSWSLNTDIKLRQWVSFPRQKGAVDVQYQWEMSYDTVSEGGQEPTKVRLQRVTILSDSTPPRGFES